MPNPNPLRYLALAIIAVALLVTFALTGSANTAPVAANGVQFGEPTATPCPNLFLDISGDTFYTAINTLYCRGLISGTDTTHFSPTDISTRAQFARIAVKALDITATTPTTPTFSDVPANYFAYVEIESGVAAGILSGYTQAQCQAAFTNYPCYLPNNPITRAELTKLVVKADQLPRQHPQQQTFSDVPTDYFAYHYIEIAYVNHIITGTDATHFAPALPIRRDEMAGIVYAAFNTLEQNRQLNMGAPEPYLGVGSALAVQRSGDPSMRMQGFWLSLQSPGTPKENGDPFTAKWDDTSGGCNCWLPGGPFQPDHSNAGYDFGFYMPDGTSGNLQIYDAAYQPKPGYYSQAGGQINPHFDSDTHCGDPSIHAPSPCPASQPDFNNLATRWCAINNVETSDNEPGTNQCNTQTQNATTIYTLYYPDSTPWYFADDISATTWTVPAVPLTGTNDGVNIMPAFAYSQTWTNFNNTAGGYHLNPYNGNHQWRLNVNVPPDNDHSTQGVIAQNNFGVRVKTNNAGVEEYALHQIPVLNNINAGVSNFYLAAIPSWDAGKTLVVSLFDIGDASGTNYIQLLSPADVHHSNPYPVSFDAYVHDKYNPPSPDIVYLNIGQFDTTRPAYDTNDKWADLVYNIPNDGSFQGGYFQIAYVFQGQSMDRTTWRVSIR